MAFPLFNRVVSPLALLLGLAFAPAYAAPGAGVPALTPDGFYLVEDEPAVVAQSLTHKALSSDKSFRDLLSRWAASSGWSVSWELDSEYGFSYRADFGPDFLKAVDGICASLNSTGVRARAIVYQENKVVRIVLEGAPR